jgi:hypothetical protein
MRDLIEQILSRVQGGRDVPESSPPRLPGPPPIRRRQTLPEIIPGSPLRRAIDALMLRLGLPAPVEEESEGDAGDQYMQSWP